MKPININILALLFFVGLMSGYGQVSNFTASDTLCISENLVLSNLSSESFSYEWDFCLEEFESVPSEFTLGSTGNLGTVRGQSIFFEEETGIYYMFLTSNSLNKMYRIAFGDSLGTHFEIETLTINSGSLDKPEGISIMKDIDGKYFGIVGSSATTVGIKRVDFGSSLTNNTVDIVNLGSFGLGNTQIRDVKLRQEEGDIILIGLDLNNKRFVTVNYGNSLTNTPSDTVISESIDNIVNATGFDIIKYQGNWIGYVTGLNTNNFVRVNFGSSLMNSITVEKEYSYSTLDRPSRVSIVRDPLNYYLIISQLSGTTQVFDLKNLSLDSIVSNFPYTIGQFDDISGAYFRGKYQFYGVKNSVLTLVSFDSECGQNYDYSTSIQPEQVFYNQPGNVIIGLTSYGLDGQNRDSKLDTIHIQSFEAPDIDFSFDDNRCISNDNQFTSINISGDIQSYSWDFDGDNVEDATTQSPVYQYASAGTYNITLNVLSSAGCENTISREFTVYDAPPVPSFDISGTLCSGTMLSFENSTDETGYDGLLTYEWDFNGEGSSTEKSPSFAFEDSGSKTVILTASIPGCSEVLQEDFTLNTGPEVAFIWTNNCFGDSVIFENQSTGTGITDYLWDFGDGSTSDKINPKHKYEVGGDYNISLTVTNAASCVSVLDQQITVNDQKLFDISHGEAIENLPVSFSGTDETLVSDQILDWEWYFGELGMSSDQNPTFTFPVPDTYEIRVYVQTQNGCIDSLAFDLEVAVAAKPTPGFNTSSEYCINELISISNTSVNADTYYWDFCGGEFDNSPISDIVKTVDGVSQIQGLDVVKVENEYYGFISDISKGTVTRLDFGTELGLSLSETQIVTGLSSPSNISLFQESMSWYAIIGSNQSGVGVTLLDFGSSLENVPETVSLGTFGQGNIQIRDAQIIHSDEGVILTMLDLSNKTMVRVNYGATINNTPIDTVVSVAINTLSNPAGFDFIRHQESLDWIFYLTSLDGVNLVKCNFGASLMNEITIEETYVISSANRPSRIEIIENSTQYYAFISNFNSSPSLVSLGDLSAAPTEIEFIAPQMYTLEGAVFDGSYYAYGFDGSVLRRFAFESNCGESLSESDLVSPIFSYNAEGEYLVTLRAQKENGVSVSITDTITITPDIAPSILFTPDQNLCIANPTIWTSEITEGNVTTYSWDLDGDGLEDSSDPNPAFQYASPGVYDIRLDVVSDAGCTNYVEDEIELYPEPPVPVFEASASTYCTESVLTLTNLTDHTAYDGLVEYHWSITGLSDTTTTGDLAISFAESGVKTISVYSAIPGCESVVAEQTVEIFDAPVTDFSATTVCSGELTAFTNLSETADYIWDFGDGIMSSGTSPEHFYASPGTYDVQLTSTDARGCESMSSKQVMVSPLPQVSFDYPQVCKGEAALFEDQSFVEQSDVIAWEWFVDDVSVATTQDASIIFETSGTHNVRLVALSQAGCIQSYAEDIEVEDTPDLLIESDGVCLYEMVTFTDETADQSNVQQRIWMVDGAVQSSSDQTLTYTFSTSGVHEVQMIVDQVTGCSGTTKLEIDIPENPQLDFVWDQNCDNEDIIFTDMTSESGNQIIASRVWKVNGEPFGNGASALLPVLGGGTYEVSLESTTDLGCELALIQTVTLDDAPDIDFTLSNDYGVPPFSLSVSNQTQYASESIWTLDGAVVSTNANPIITIDSEGVKTLKLVATGSSGCKDSSSATINSALPIIDLRINEMQLLENGNANNILVNLSNLSNIPVETLSFSIELEDEFVLPEQVYRRIESNEQAVITLNTSIPADYGDLKYLCVSVYSTYDVDDLTPVNNGTCQNLATQKPVFEPPFPNPAKDQTVVKAVLPESGEATISVIDMSGQIQVQKFLPEVPAGLNVFEVTLLGLDGGTYMIDISFKGGNYNYRVIKQ